MFPNQPYNRSYLHYQQCQPSNQQPPIAHQQLYRNKRSDDKGTDYYMSSNNRLIEDANMNRSANQIENLFYSHIPPKASSIEPARAGNTTRRDRYNTNNTEYMQQYRFDLNMQWMDQQQAIDNYNEQMAQANTTGGRMMQRNREDLDRRNLPDPEVFSRSGQDTRKTHMQYSLNHDYGGTNM
jgi:hypothetical protein